MNFDSPSESPATSAQQWFDEAVAAKATPNPLAVALSTVDHDGKPSTRMVLLKGFDEKGAVFYTNYASPKALDLVNNTHASMLFHWDDSQRQLRIRGTVTKVSEEESDAYFATRQKLSQVERVGKSPITTPKEQGGIDGKSRCVDGEVGWAQCSSTSTLGWFTCFS